MLGNQLVTIIALILSFYLIIYVLNYFQQESFKPVLMRKKTAPRWECPKGYSQEYMHSIPSIRGNTIKYGSGPGLVPAPIGGVCMQNCPPGFMPDRFPTSEPRDKCWYNCSNRPGYFNNGPECRKFASKDPVTGKITRGDSFPRPFHHRKYTFPQPLCSDGYKRNTLSVTNPQWYRDHIKKRFGVLRSHIGDSQCYSDCPKGFIGVRNMCLKK